MVDFITREIILYHCPKCLVAADSDEWYEDPWIGLSCEECGSSVKRCGQRPAQWWSVGVYETGRSYGGPEEGGWWYDTGQMIDPYRVRGFNDIEKAKKYRLKLSEIYKDCPNTLVRGFTEQFPVDGYPSVRPVYS